MGQRAEGTNVTELHPLRRETDRAWERSEKARVDRLHAEADWLEHKSKKAKRAFDVAAEAERATERAFRASVRRQLEAEGGSR